MNIAPFDTLTNLYSLSKTLRFELKPVGKTKDLLDLPGFFEKDEKKAELYPKMKDRLDWLHRNFINQSLSKITWLEISDDIYSKFVNKVEFDTKFLRKAITDNFEWSKDLAEKDVIEQLLIKYPDHKWEIEQFKWFWGYFTTYKQNRDNLYKNEGKAWQIATRLIDENLPRFLKNKQISQTIKENYPDFNVIEKNSDQRETIKDLSSYNWFFSLTWYHNFITQSWINYYNEIVWHINHSINQYKQKHPWVKIPLLQILYKLPLSPRKVIDRLPKQIETHEDIERILESVIDRMEKKIIWFVKDSVLPVLAEETTFDRKWVYISLKTLESWSWIWLNSWSSMRELTHELKKWKDEITVKDEKFPFRSLQEIASFLDDKQNEGVEAEVVFGDLKSKSISTASFSHYFFRLISNNISVQLSDYEQAISNYRQLSDKQTIKSLLDSALKIWRLLWGFQLVHKKIHITPKDNVKDNLFYDGASWLDAIMEDEDYDPIHIVYDKVRNFETKKPYSNDEKIKVNFQNPTLLDWRDENKEKENYGVVLRNAWKYFLAIMKKWNNNFFDTKKNALLYEGSGYEKMVYKLLPWPNKMLPKVIFSKKNIALFNPSEHILRIREEETFKQGDKFSLADLHIWIDFLKESLKRYEWWKWYSFNFLPTSQYHKINEFYHDVESQWYSLKWKSVDSWMIDAEIEMWNLYLFEIYNKDFNTYSKWSKNLHTKYFESVMEWLNSLFKLNGEAELFWRKAWGVIEVREKSPKYNLNIINKRRYTEDKLMFHVPITINFCLNELKFNDRIKSLIKSNSKDFTILGIDRWEKHLLYYSLIRQDGKIIQTWTWNVVWPRATDYHSKLTERESKRDSAQMNWDQQEQIKDLKRGYISQVVHEITNMIIEYNAIVVLEDLNGWFKRSRQKVEKNVYQQFELALAKKLNYLVFKNRAADEVWWTMKWYQLTPQIWWFWDLSFQTGIIFYTPAGYTSTTCPCCGRRKHLYLKYVNEKQAKADLSKINIIKDENSYMISYEMSDEANRWKKKDVRLNMKWTMETKDQTRSQYSPSTRVTTDYNITDELDKVFVWPDNFDFASRLSHATSSQCKTLIYYLNLLMKIRNAKTGTNIDIIQCPSCGFNSEDWFQWKQYNWDANWAYNIARKWVIIMDKIIAWENSTTVSQFECDSAWVK